MIRTTHAARRLVAALAAVLLAGMLGLGALAGFSSHDRRSAGTTASSASPDTAGHPRLTVAKATSDDHSIAVDLPAGTLDTVFTLGLAAMAAVTVAALATQIGTAAPVPAGRAPPRR